jgi:hypothetical protein
LRVRNQIFIEWSIRRIYEDFSFTKTIDSVLKETDLKEGEMVEVHQVVNLGEFNGEKVFLIILNVITNKN